LSSSALTPKKGHVHYQRRKSNDEELQQALFKPKAHGSKRHALLTHILFTFLTCNKTRFTFLRGYRVPAKMSIEAVRLAIFFEKI